MMVASEADEAWCPPTFIPSSFSRRWLALWMVQAESHRTFFSNSPKRSWLVPAKPASPQQISAEYPLVARVIEALDLGRLLRVGGEFGPAGQAEAVAQQEPVAVLQHHLDELAFLDCRNGGRVG